MTWKTILRLLDPSTFDAIQSYAVTSDAQMPLAYQNILGGGGSGGINSGVSGVGGSGGSGGINSGVSGVGGGGGSGGINSGVSGVGGGRPLHDDWGIMSTNPILMFLQPWQKITRMSTAYRVPLPLKQTKGLCFPQWMLWDPSYPASPGLKTEIRADGYTYALVDCAVEGSGASEFSAFINGAWKPVFTQYRRMIFGRLLAHYSGGLKGDVTVTPQPGGAIKSDIMGWWDPPSLSYNAP
jgi:hypothetical protein